MATSCPRLAGRYSPAGGYAGRVAHSPANTPTNGTKAHSKQTIRPGKQTPYSPAHDAHRTRKNRMQTQHPHHPAPRTACSPHKHGNTGEHTAPDGLPHPANSKSHAQGAKEKPRRKRPAGVKLFCFFHHAPQHTKRKKQDTQQNHACTPARLALYCFHVGIFFTSSRAHCIAAFMLFIVSAGVEYPVHHPGKYSTIPH